MSIKRSSYMFRTKADRYFTKYNLKSLGEHYTNHVDLESQNLTFLKESMILIL